MVPKDRKYRVLIVDDDAVLRETVGRYMQRAGYVVATASDAESALERTEPGDEEFDVVITDVHMPRMNGIDLMSRLLARRPGQCVVVITGYADQMLAQIALAHGARSFLQKPFALGELEAIVTEALTMSSAPRPTSRLG